MTEHKHQTILRGAAEELLRTGFIRTFDAVYRWVCPDCGGAQRTTRLADTIYALRHAYGWNIRTHAESEQLAVYTLVKPGDMPGDPSKGPHPRVLVRDQLVPQPTGYKPYVGKPVPVEAIPSPKKWRCISCELIVSEAIGQPQLGGFRRAPCPKCGYENTKAHLGRIFVPVASNG